MEKIIKIEVIIYAFVYQSKLVIGSLHLEKVLTSTKSGPKKKRVKGMHLLVVLSVAIGWITFCTCVP